MPLFDYRCRACAHEFEGLVRGSETPVCPSCQSADLEQLTSLFAVSSDSTRQSTLAAARQKMKSSKDLRDKQVAENEAIKHHLQDH